MSTSAAIEAKNASFGYAGQPFIAHLNLRVEPGDVVALLGPNGSGKSTLVRGLLGLNEQLGGTVHALGGPIGDRDVRERLGYVPQRHTLSGSVRSTVREIVATGRLAHRRWWQHATKRDAELVQEALETVGLADRASADVANLSGGQQRRVLIARALAGEPDVLIMDEPTAGVDAASQEVLARLIERLAQRGVTMLIVTHELTALQSAITHIVEMNAGEVVFDGRVADYTAPALPGHGHHHDAPVRSTPLMAGPYDPRVDGDES
ncbi:metal ABC transporter ATP-binding protein [Ornithinimicrobium sp. INDO-MA30-4]|uniref:metal ABC transporter ATP-binding protein n=1 Tax=Ornithinimicrobium sp. INDO-MA30-4 TaxID=2908651 RepID=UPI001F2A5033|nr:ABC transporter ATP-binding protein [Ornithinimicrobium sp. INDO-MA30-4]UJH70892.1 ABC transporter ATP-binding protein [Ornithinimicrobium sp. INDO-MA30-4]